MGTQSACHLQRGGVAVDGDDLCAGELAEQGYAQVSESAGAEIDGVSAVGPAFPARRAMVATPGRREDDGRGQVEAFVVSALDPACIFVPEREGQGPLGDLGKGFGRPLVRA